jgi:hypothetical protein
MTIQVFLQSELLTDIAVVELNDAPTSRDLRRACTERVTDTQVDGELFLYVEDDDDEDAVDKLKTVTDGLRVHLHRLKAIDVTVRYAGKEVRRTFRPNATIARVKRWAGQEFGIAASDAVELMLQVTGSNARPDQDVHLGSLVKVPQHAICFDLVPAPRVNG